MLLTVLAAHPGRPPEPHDLWTAWTWDPATLLLLGLAAWLYTSGVRRAWRRAGTGRGIALWRPVAFAIGLLALFVALVSPVEALGSALFTAHMVQHLLLIMVAAPLLVLGAPPSATLWSLPLVARRRLVAWWRHRSVVRAAWWLASSPVVVWAAHTLGVWLWHAPSLYEWALRSDLLHVAEHTSFLLTALLFWWLVFPSEGMRRLGHGPAILLTFAASMQATALGALMAIAPAPWYGAYALTASAWGVSALEDQQIAGLIMWMPGGLVYAAAAGVLFVQWLRAAERSSVRSPHRSV